MSRLVIDSTPSRGKYWSELGFNVVTIDVLRASSTIIVALLAGAKEVIPFAEVDDAVDFSKKKPVLLAGERKGEIIPGFDYTNSPADLSKVDLTGQSLVLTTSDGTRLITEAAEAKHSLVASTLNYEVIAQAILGIGGDWAIIGAGSSGDFRPEDKVGCALVGDQVRKIGKYDISSEHSDFIDLFSVNWQRHILDSLSVSKLQKIGRQIDVDFVIDEANNFSVVPKVSKQNDLVSITR